MEVASPHCLAYAVAMENSPQTRQTLLAKEGLALLLGLAAIVAGAVLYPLEPVGGQAVATADAPWIFLGLQQILRFTDPLWGGVALPIAALCWLGALPWLTKDQGLPTPRKRRPAWAEWIAWGMLAAWLGLTVWGYWA